MELRTLCDVLFLKVFWKVSLLVINIYQNGESENSCKITSIYHYLTCMCVAENARCCKTSVMARGKEYKEKRF